jgi:trimethylamine--corrinoid protein Co-methyltransferase
MTDSKVPDAQAGYEKAYNFALVANAGANLIYESAGMMASLLGFSLEQAIVDNDIVGAAQRTIRGIDVNDDALSVETIADVCLNGPGHFLGSEQTIRLMQKEYVYPAVGDRSNPKEWTERGRTSVVDRAHVRLKEILGNHFPRHIPKSVDDAIRAKFPVRLPVDAMNPAGHS